MKVQFSACFDIHAIFKPVLHVCAGRTLRNKETSFLTEVIRAYVCIVIGHNLYIYHYVLKQKSCWGIYLTW